jgi:hypothetical protein
MSGITRFAFAVAVCALTADSGMLSAQGDGKPRPEPKRPQLIVKATPGSGMVPVRVSGVAELKGGDNDFEEYYCPTIEWNWGDGTISESSNDCEPYEAGKSQIKRRYSVSHPYRQGGHFRISFRMKQRDKVVASSSAVVQLLGGMPY